MTFQCDRCNNRFDSDEDVDGESCNRCDEGIVYEDTNDYRDMIDISLHGEPEDEE